jgi:carbon-monoxide dehydrogenase medium subunit
MKPAPFSYEQISQAQQVSVALLRSDVSVKIIAGGQSLGPMLNLRLAQPTHLIDITRLAALKTVQSSSISLTLGACVTHANIEDGCAPGRLGEILAEIARAIAYRAVRNRGTLGGSLAHADPSADWITTLTALDAELSVRRADGQRWMKLAGAMSGPFDIGLGPGEWIDAVRIPEFASGSAWGYTKIARKTGEFAHAMVAFLHRPAQSSLRIVFGATESAPIVIDHPDAIVAGANLEPLKALAHERLLQAGLSDPIDNRVRLTVMERAIRKAQSGRRA